MLTQFSQVDFSMNNEKFSKYHLLTGRVEGAKDAWLWRKSALPYK